MPKNTMNNGIHARVGTCANALNVGNTRRSARALKPSQAPSNAPAPMPASKPQNKRCTLIARWLHSSPPASSTALLHTNAGGGRICSLIH
ncbi:hypothetical protein [Pseudomonas sp. 34 E 7]|nr:hypothetical protein [Pseudomonas sp. 34 E 7]